ncbi:iron ABC transporter ATP-binding protein [Brevundimonas sp. LM2]|uniref:ABC transporter ATP-binding protein n=1 Tax=Brevundimonas sp. LM2 TaxID=1938605 RepID=UPI000983CAF0|nr:ABC transporter ATP-binding protein [Brevundimonas sp. LM2]AQR62175.1 iron ABC transporter ATP-binding protein [Brevundimonas sp. LM2]
MAVVIGLKDVSARLDRHPVLQDVSLSVAPGELVALVGPNGAGKTSVLKAMLGLLPPSAGTVAIGGRPLAELDPRARAEAMAYLPQDRRIAWNMPAVEITALGLPFLSGAEARTRAREALVEVQAGDLAERGVAEMSGGERARVLIARVLATGAKALLLDEPVAGLDPDAQFLLMDRLRARATAGQAVVVSLHDLSMAARYADRVVVMAGGRVVADAPPVEALSAPVLAEVFGLQAEWLSTPDGPLLSARRNAPY